MKHREPIYIFDTTLRDGQQSPGAGMSLEDNLIYAQHAHELGIDILEAGFPAASQHDFEIVHTIAQRMTDQHSKMKIASLSQLREEQVVRTMEALQPCLSQQTGRVHLYIPVDPHLMPFSLGKMADDLPFIVNEVHRLVKLATDAGFEVEFSAEGYSRMKHHFNFTTDVFRAAVSGGARIINCPDTIGGASRFQGDDYFVHHMKKHHALIQSEFPKSAIIWSTHCHNDLGLPLDNSIEAVFSGVARQIEGCINGVGERAGNVSLEQCIMMIELFGKTARSDCELVTGIRLEKLTEISNFISEKMLPRQPHSPITGDNAACHSSGGHTNAILKNPMAYQPFDPKRVGNDIRFVFGPLSGSNHAKAILEKYGYTCSEEEKVEVTQAIKNQFSNRRKGITDDELIAFYKEYRGLK